MTIEHSIVIGYGSLMSCNSWKEDSLHKAIKRVFIVEVDGIRGFAKPTMKGTLAMDVDCLGFAGRFPRNNNPWPIGWPETLHLQALAVEIPDTALLQIAKREGYKWMLNIVNKARTNDKTPAKFLWELLWKNEDDWLDFSKKFKQQLQSFQSKNYCSIMIRKYDCIYSPRIREYRMVLGERFGLSPDYNPHPIKLPNGQFGIIFIAAGRLHPQGTNRAKKKKGFRVMPLEEAAKACDLIINQYNIQQISIYCLHCLLGQVQGVDISDIGKLINNSSIQNYIHSSLQHCIEEEIKCLTQHSNIARTIEIAEMEDALKAIQKSLTHPR